MKLPYQSVALQAKDWPFHHSIVRQVESVGIDSPFAAPDLKYVYRRTLAASFIDVIRSDVACSYSIDTKLGSQ
jgi:hypothetical protein